jgi:hypothetical protein
MLNATRLFRRPGQAGRAGGPRPTTGWSTAAARILLLSSSTHDVTLPAHEFASRGHTTEGDMLTALLLTISNVFMTFAWYGHLRYKNSALWLVILVSWLIAFLEYCFQVPANRIGHGQFSAAQLKILQEVITLVVFAVFSVAYLREELRWNYIVGFALILAAVVFVFGFGPQHGGPTVTRAP